MKRIRAHRREFRAIWKQTRLLIEQAIAEGFKVAIEWPSGCEYWKWPMVIKVVTACQLRKARCNGCAAGLAGDRGRPMFKPWTTATNCDTLYRAIDVLRCTCPEGAHQHVAGRGTKPTEGYTDEIARVVHRAWKRSCEA